jgi:hexosaminidase
MSGAMLTTTVLAQPAPAPQSQFVNTLMPQPAQLTVSNGELDLSHGVGIGADKFHDDRLDNAITWFRERLQTQTGTMMETGAASVVISVDGPGQAVQGLDEDESYSLDIASQGVHLHAATDVGAMRGLETLLQLVQSDGQGFGSLWFLSRMRRASGGAGL